MKLAVALILLHALDGREIRVNPRTVVSLTEPKHTTEHAGCVLSFIGERYVSVLESCPDVAIRLKGAPP